LNKTFIAFKGTQSMQFYFVHQIHDL